MEQHTAAWWSARLGKVTASRIGDIMARTQKGLPTAARGHYLREKVAERITGKSRDKKIVKSLSDRLDLEPDAIAAYEFYYDRSVQRVGFIEHPRIPFAGASPDGLVDSDGGIEIKCCDAEMHLEIVTAEAIDPDYVWQIHFNMACTERSWWDFTAFNPDMPEELKLWVRRFDRDEEKIAQIESNVIEFLGEVDAKVAQVRDAVSGRSSLTAALESSLESMRVN